MTKTSTALDQTITLAEHTPKKSSAALRREAMAELHDLANEPEA